MIPKRRPPKDNDRRVKSNGSNKRGVTTDPANTSVQFESDYEDNLATLLFRMKGVQKVISQPTAAVVQFYDIEGKKHKYTPDFMVTFTEGRIEIHEFSMAKKRLEFNIKRREEAAQNAYSQKGWAYVVHTDQTMPSPTELANLQILSGYKASEYFDPAITDVIMAVLSDRETHKVIQVGETVANLLKVTKGRVNSTIFYLMWHQMVWFSPDVLLFVDASLNRKSKIALAKE